MMGNNNSNIPLEPALTCVLLDATMHSYPTSPSLSTDHTLSIFSSHVILVGGEDCKIHVYDVCTQRQLCQYQLPSAVTKIIYGPIPYTITVGTQEGHIVVIDIKEHK